MLTQCSTISFDFHDHNSQLRGEIECYPDNCVLVLTRLTPRDVPTIREVRGDEDGGLIEQDKLLEAVHNIQEFLANTEEVNHD